MTAQIIGEILKEMEIISQEQLEASLHVQKATNEALGEILVKLNFVTTDELAHAIAKQNNLEYIDLDSYVPTRDTLKLIDSEFAVFNMILPLKIDEDVLVVVTAWPNDETILEYLQESTGYPIRFAVSDTKAIGKYIQFYYEQLDYPIENKINDMIKDSVEKKEIDIITFVNFIISNALKDRVTDIHITPERLTSHVFYRIDGVLKHSFSIPSAVHNHIILRIKVLAKLDIAQHLLPQNGDFDFEFFQNNYNIRASIIPVINGEKLALRLMPENFKLLTLENLGFESNLAKQLSQNLQKNSGIILIIGASGSGKTTTLYAMLRKIDILKRNVVSVEEPVEYHLPFVNQVQINTRSNYTYNKALHSIARQDPDVIAIGEILDEETAKLAIQSSATGHLILSTLSGSSGITTIARLKDLGVDKYLLADGLLSIVSQKLLRRLCNECKKEVELSRDELIKYFSDSAETILSLGDERVKLYEAVGCEHCRQSGYVGRLAIIELLQVDEVIRDMIEHDKSSIEIQNYVRSTGSVDMKTDALQKLLNGTTSLQEVMRIVN
ncbi:Flp pilus assembly complex ATPase component TadA [Candidatus Sulfurimonas marisnigri]|uniref:Flp pilus assembly complex ATPase component TadA n=1 Tax=Candidatus Sulfurimonas marisnigri TaxID=2740405 RepID=A0A7S7LZU6_9BACT|nr:GspE/PulE family protein [Candidatus Sulfurimonas marisnigri]QOY54518.1 Flp pilus assembly complex ATPase component TadA [Candidatus Sulfurimonas marisnigri]